MCKKGEEEPTKFVWSKEDKAFKCPEGNDPVECPQGEKKGEGEKEGEKPKEPKCADGSTPACGEG